ncbi:MAG: chemotaxis protein CheD [Bacillota bacterium]
MSEMLKVGMADLAVGRSPAILKTCGLGSCVGICLLDPGTKVGGMAHIMLPVSSLAKSVENPAKYADTAVPLMVKRMQDLGANRSRMIAKIAGGAQMFLFAGSSEVMRIGERNAQAVKDALRELGIHVIAEDIGGNYGRTIEFACESGTLKIKTFEHGEREL